MTGSITTWDAFTGQGLVTGDMPLNGVHVVKSTACSPGLQQTLSQKAIPPDTPVRVSFDVTAVNEAIHVDSL